MAKQSKKSATQTAKPTPRATTRAAAPKRAPEAVAPEVTGSEAAYARFLPPALELAARDVAPFRLDVMLAAHNVRVGVEAVLAAAAGTGPEALPKTDWAALADLPELALGLVFAATQVDRAPGASDVRALLAEGHELRNLLLAAARALALAGLVPAREIAKIEQGRGPLDMARDLGELAALFRKYPEARAKSPVSAAQLTRAGDLGATLIVRLRPQAAKAPKVEAAALRKAVDARDRLATLLVRGHGELWRAGAYLLGHAVEDQVPALQGRFVAKKPAPTKAAPPATPVAG